MVSGVECVGPKMYPVKEVKSMAECCRYLTLHTPKKDVFDRWLNEMAEYGYSLVSCSVDGEQWYFGVIERPPDDDKLFPKKK